jgi:protein involved in polysaccharide export with SLBB domain
MIVMVRKRIIYAALTVLVTCLFSSCITNKQKKYLQTGEPVYKQVDFEEYKLRVDDEISYQLITTNRESQSVFNINGGNAYRIYDDGTVYLPFVGQVELVGLTIREAQVKLKAKFREYTSDAEIKVALANNYFYVLGDGGKGQFYMYKDNLNIYQAMAMAGDISSIGDKKHIKLVRKGADGIDRITTFDLRKESIIESEFYYVKPNDVIYIPTNPNSFFRVESFSSFVSLFVAPLSLLFIAISMF